MKMYRIETRSIVEFLATGFDAAAINAEQIAKGDKAIPDSGRLVSAEVISVAVVPSD